MAYGKRAQFGMAKQTVFGTAVTPAAVFLSLIEESLETKIEQIANPGIRGVVGRYASRVGLKTFEGNATFEFHPNKVGHLLRMLFGAPTTTPGPVGVYSHVFKLDGTDFAAGCPTPPYTVEVYRDLGQAFQYLDTVATSLQLSFGTGDKALKAQVGMMAKNVARVAKSAPTFEAVDAFLWKQAVVKKATVAYADLESFTWNFDTLLKALATLNATDVISRYFRDGEPTHSLQMTVDPSDDAEWTDFLNAVDEPLSIEFTGPDIVAGSPYALKIEFAKVRYTGYPLVVKGPGRIQVGPTADVYYDPTLGYDVQVTLTNSEVSY